MSRRDEIVRRIHFVREQLTILGSLVDQLEIGYSAPAPAPAAPAPVVAAPPPAPVRPEPRAEDPVELLSKPRWSYLPGAAYRVVGVNPFRRDGNNFQLFNHLVERFGDAPFTFEQLNATIDALRADRTIDTDQTTDSFLRVFLRQGGLEKGRIAMASASPLSASKPPVRVRAAATPVPAPRAAPRPATAVAAAPEAPAEPTRRAPAVLRRRAAEVVAPPAAPADELPPEAGDEAAPRTDAGVTYRIAGTPTFRGDTATKRIATVLGTAPFTRASVTALVREMCADGRIVARRPVPLLVDDLFKVLGDQGVLAGA